jgi:hypothetical protein
MVAHRIWASWPINIEIWIDWPLNVNNKVIRSGMVFLPIIIPPSRCHHLYVFYYNRTFDNDPAQMSRLEKDRSPPKCPISQFNIVLLWISGPPQISSEEQLLNRKIDKSINVKSVETDFNSIWCLRSKNKRVVNGCHEDKLEDGDTDDDKKEVWLSMGFVWIWKYLINETRMLFILICEMCYYRSNLAELLEKHVNSCHVENDDIVWTVDPNNNSPRVTQIWNW